MRISVIGASAGVGLETVQAALTRGHTVTTLSRSVESLQGYENVTVVRGSAASAEDVRTAVADADAVLVTLGTSSLGATTLFSDAATALAEALAGSDVALIVVTGFGAGDSAQLQNPFLRTVMKGLLGRMYADKGRMEEIITATDLRWEIVRPGVLSNKGAVGTTTGMTTFRKGMKVPGISRKDLAEFLVDEAEQRRYIRRFVLPAARP
jgi:putative NADH-flavin reductase